MTHAPSRPRRLSAGERIVYLLKTCPRTSLVLSRAGGLNYRARISDLRKAGYKIICRRHPTKAGVNIYILLHGPRGTR